VNREGGAKAPDLGAGFDRNYTPAGIAARMWNHAPVMWTQMSSQNLPLPKVDTEQVANLFTFFYSVRYFEKRGEPELGKRVFETKHCAECHSIASSAGSVGPPVEKWASLADPVVLVQRMWNHADTMTGEMASRKIPWPTLTANELNDLLVYLQNLPETQGARLEFIMPPWGSGAELFVEKGCIDCHKGAMALENRLSDDTLTDVAAALWNHAPQMQQPHPELSVNDMRRILGYVWVRQFFQTHGDAKRGRKTFETKKCGACHNEPSSGAPDLSKSSQPDSSISMVEVLWRHGPTMLQRMRDKRIPWPQFTQDEMVNLIAYLNSIKRPERTLPP